MKKPYRYDEMPTERCDVKECRKHLKKNVTERVQRRPLTCYEHHQASVYVRKQRRGKA